jgi:hypothetical protein
MSSAKQRQFEAKPDKLQEHALQQIAALVSTTASGNEEIKLWRLCTVYALYR